MSKGRLEAFSDGVLAIVITIMVLELHVPEGEGFADLRPLLPLFSSYVLSFAYVGIYWNNHHHMFQAIRQVDGRTLWTNLHLLFWLSLIPFSTAWMGQTDFASAPTATYGAVLLMASLAYYHLSRTLIALHGRDSALATAVGSDTKGRVSAGLYAAALPLAFVGGWAAMCVYVLVAFVWIVPDRRIARVLAG